MDEARDNRSLLLDLALRLFSERGYEAVGVAEISGDALVTKPTLYHYFGSKRGLLDAIISERGGALLLAVSEAARYAGDVPLGLERIAFAFARSALADPDFSRMRLALAFAPPDGEGGSAAAAFNARLFEAVAAFFRAAEEDHGNMKGRSRPFAATFIGTIDTYTGLYLAGFATLGEDEVRAAVRQFMYGIFS